MLADVEKKLHAAFLKHVPEMRQRVSLALQRGADDTDHLLEQFATVSLLLLNVGAEHELRKAFFEGAQAAWNEPVGVL